MKREHFYKLLDSYMDAAWNKFSTDGRKQITTSNNRMYKILYKLKGEDFVVELKKYIKKHGGFLLIHLSKTKEGIEVKDKTFGKTYVSTNNGTDYRLFIPLNDRYIFLNVSNLN